MKIKEPLFVYINKNIEYKIINGYALKELDKIGDRKFDLIITSPTI